MNLTVFITSALLAASIGFGAAWQLQQARIEHEQNNRLTQQAAAQQALHDLEQARSTQVIAAQNSARVRERKLRLDAATSSAAITSLRDALHTVVREAQANPAACVERTTTVSELLAICGQSLGELSTKADRHVSDLELMQSAWPK